MAAGDRGFYSKRNEQQAHVLGVRKVALPAKGRLSETQAEKQKQPWFKRALRWRGLGEGRIATLKHRCSMLRAVYKGDIGFKRHVGWSIIVNNLVCITRARKRKVIQDASQKLAA